MKQRLLDLIKRNPKTTVIKTRSGPSHRFIEPSGAWLPPLKHRCSRPAWAPSFLFSSPICHGSIFTFSTSRSFWHPPRAVEQEAIQPGHLRLCSPRQAFPRAHWQRPQLLQLAQLLNKAIGSTVPIAAKSEQSCSSCEVFSETRHYLLLWASLHSMWIKRMVRILMVKKSWQRSWTNSGSLGSWSPVVNTSLATSEICWKRILNFLDPQSSSHKMRRWMQSNRDRTVEDAQSRTFPKFFSWPYGILCRLWLNMARAPKENQLVKRHWWGQQKERQKGKLQKDKPEIGEAKCHWWYGGPAGNGNTPAPCQRHMFYKPVEQTDKRLAHAHGKQGQSSCKWFFYLQAAIWSSIADALPRLRRSPTAILPNTSPKNEKKIEEGKRADERREKRGIEGERKKGEEIEKNR